MVPVFKKLITYLTTVTEYSKCFKECEPYGNKQSENSLILPRRRFPEKLHRSEFNKGWGSRRGSWPHKERSTVCKQNKEYNRSRKT